MAETRRYALGNQLDIQQILLEAQHRWLRPAEICEILQNYKDFRIAAEPANMPPSGSLFLFNRKVLRYFRKDGHSWRKKKDGKTVKEAHERLKAGSVDVLHCYYAHGEENENFQRRSYWMLEEELSHIVLVHYREVKGNRTNYNHIQGTEEAAPVSQETEGNASTSEIGSYVSSTFHANSYQVPSQTTDTTSLNSNQVSEYEDAESAYNQQVSSRFPSVDLQQPVMDKIGARIPDPYYPLSLSNDYEEKMFAIPGMGFTPLAQADSGTDRNGAGLTHEPRKHREFSWEDILENSTAGIQSFPSSLSSTPYTPEIFPKEENEIGGQLFTDRYGTRQDFGSHPQFQEEWQTSEGSSSCLSEWPVDQKVNTHLAYDLTSRFHEQEVNYADLLNSHEPSHPHPDKKNDPPMQNNLQMQLPNSESGFFAKLDSENNLSLDGNVNYSSTKNKHLLDLSLGEESLKKLDSFNRWMSKELGDVTDSHTQSISGAYWDTVESGSEIDDSSIPPQVRLDTYMLDPSLSRDQLFSIIDFSPNWAYVGSELKVLITGTFLKSQQEAQQCKWSCMFGEVEVPAEVIADGVLRCCTPMHKAGRVPFYVTCSNRLACSEVREFEYRVKMDAADNYIGSTSAILRMRFEKLLSLSTADLPQYDDSSESEKSNLSSKISLLMKDDIDEWGQMLMLTSEDDLSEKENEQLLQKLLKMKLHVWLLQKVAEGGKGPSVLDEGGQGVLHYAAALGYDWALHPTIVAGVSVNFRDVNGWTALHWAAFCGRERTVASLLNLDAAPGALTDPSPKYPSGRTPADLASANGHKGIAGYLAEAALSAHLELLDLDTKEGKAAETSGAKAVQTVSERSAIIADGDLPYGLSLKDSLAVVCNATQVAARIHQVFRVQSFQKKQLKEYEDDQFGSSDERALSRIALKSHKPTQHDEPVAAAIRIQNKFRSFKGRKDYLIIRQGIVKIQAHVRGHQVRKNYRKIIWSVGILEKIILRWRRKGSGLRGFKPETHTDGPSWQDPSPKVDDFDFLKEGRKQTEERLQKALARVKSMVQYPEARDQYRRLLNVVTEIQENKADSNRVLDSSEENADFDDLIDIEALLDDDTFMPTTS